MKKILRLLLILSIFIGSSFMFAACDGDIILVTGVDLYTNEIYADVNEKIDLSYKVYPNNATNKKVTFWSTDENIASVDANGKVTVKDFGEASIVVRSVDGGFEDYCKIITNIDPEEIEWDTTDKLTAVSETGYSATASMALNQVMKLKINYLIDDVISDEVTNKKVVFTSSNNTNIQVINESEGIIKAVNNEILQGDRAYSDITATLETTDGTLAITCRVYINEYSSLDHLYINYKNGDMQVLDQRNGAETIYLTSNGDSVEFYAYLTNPAGVVKTDYDMSIVSSRDDIFTVDILSVVNGIYKFRLTPQDIEETATLYVRTTCSNENGKTIRCNVNVTVQAEIKSAKASATNRKDGDMEVLLNGEIFGIDLTYFDELGNKIDGAVRNIYFDPLDLTISQYISNYGNNQFKVKAVPASVNQVCQLTGYFYVENVETSEKITFEYKFYLRNSLESLIVSEVAKEPNGEIPSTGVSAVTMTVGGSSTLYAYATTYDFALSEPATVSFRLEDDSIISVVSTVANQYVITSKAGDEGVAKIWFVATDGLFSIEYEVTVYVVGSIAEVNFYEGYETSGGLIGKIDDTYTVASGTAVLRLYLKVEALNPDVVIECEGSIALQSEDGTICELLVASNTKTIRYIEIDLSEFTSGDSITVSANRVFASKSIVIEIA